MMNIMDVYAWFFREGGYRLMRLLVIKAEYEPGRYRYEFDVVALMRLRSDGEIPAMRNVGPRVRERDLISDIMELDRALDEAMSRLPREWRDIVETYYGRGVKKLDGKVIRKGTAESALAGVCRAIQEKKGWYDFALEGLPAVYKLMFYLIRASRTGGDISQSLLMKAAMCMKLFRNSENGILYTDALEEFCERTIPQEEMSAVWGREDTLKDELLIREDITDGQQRSRLESKLSEDRSSVLIDRMYEVHTIMCAVRNYLPEKYEHMMSFRWTKRRERLMELFWEVAAMLAAAEDRMEKQTHSRNWQKMVLIP